MDLYQEELTRWLELKAMTSEERRQWWIRKYEAHTCSDVALSAEEFRQYVTITMSQKGEGFGTRPFPYFGF